MSIVVFVNAPLLRPVEKLIFFHFERRASNTNLVMKMAENSEQKIPMINVVAKP
jgi:hypothetical protein